MSKLEYLVIAKDMRGSSITRESSRGIFDTKVEAEEFVANKLQAEIDVAIEKEANRAGVSFEEAKKEFNNANDHIVVEHYFDDADCSI